MFPFLGLIGPVFTAIGNLAKGYFDHKKATTEAARDVELASIQAGVAIQKGGWKDEYFTIFWTVPLYPPLFDSVWQWNPQIFINYVNALPLWYTTILIGMTTASFGVKTYKEWKASVLDREITWDRHANGNGNGAPVPPTPPRVKGPMDHA